MITFKMLPILVAFIVAIASASAIPAKRHGIDTSLLDSAIYPLPTSSALARAVAKRDLPLCNPGARPVACSSHLPPGEGRSLTSPHLTKRYFVRDIIHDFCASGEGSWLRYDDYGDQIDIELQGRECYFSQQLCEDTFNRMLDSCPMNNYLPNGCYEESASMDDHESNGREIFGMILTIAGPVPPPGTNCANFKREIEGVGEDRDVDSLPPPPWKRVDEPLPGAIATTSQDPWKRSASPDATIMRTPQDSWKRTAVPEVTSLGTPQDPWKRTALLEVTTLGTPQDPWKRTVALEATTLGTPQDPWKRADATVLGTPQDPWKRADATVLGTPQGPWKRANPTTTTSLPSCPTTPAARSVTCDRSPATSTSAGRSAKTSASDPSQPPRMPSWILPPPPPAVIDPVPVPHNGTYLSDIESFCATFPSSTTDDFAGALYQDHANASYTSLYFRRRECDFSAEMCEDAFRFVVYTCALTEDFGTDEWEGGKVDVEGLGEFEMFGLGKEASGIDA